MATYTLDFEKLDKQGIPKAKTLDFLRNKTQHNFNIDELESIYKNKGYTQEQTINALYENLESASKSGGLWLRPLPKDNLNHSEESTQNNTTSLSQGGTRGLELRSLLPLIPPDPPNPRQRFKRSAFHAI